MNGVGLCRTVQRGARCFNILPAACTVSGIKPICYQPVNVQTFSTSGVNFCETRAQDEKIKEEAKEETKNADEEEAIKNKILDASLAHVGQHGWTRMSLTAGAEDAGYVSLVSGLFPNEGSDLVFHHVKTSNQKLNDWMTKEVERLQADGKKLSVGVFLKAAVVERLKMNEPYLKNGRWGEALAILGKPQNIPASVSLLQEVCDDIWHRAGDNSTDMNWYSKRMLLAGVFSSTEMFMLQDTSENFQETWNFLDRRFVDVNGLPQLSKIPEDVCALVSGIVTTAKVVAGVQK